MKPIDFGKVITALREKYGYTQKQLAYKLGYSVSNISRMENGFLIPSFSAIEYALQLLGEDSQDYIAFFLDVDDKYAYQTVNQLRILHIQEDFEGMHQLLAEAEGKKPFASGLYRQALLFYKTLIDENIPTETKLERLIEAIEITIEDFDPNKLRASILSHNEILIISEIAKVYHHLKDTEKAAKILTGVRESMDRNYMDENEKSRTYPTVLYNLSVYLGALERNTEMYDVCVEAKRIAIRYNNMRALPSILATIAHAKFLKGDYIGMKDDLLQAYMSARAMERYRVATRISEVSITRYGIDIEKVYTDFIQSPRQKDYHTGESEE